MNSVGIDVSKGKSMIAIMRPFGEIVVSPFEVNHTSDELSKLVKIIMDLDGETRVIMEYTGRYYEPIAQILYDAGIFVSVVNAILIHDYGDNSIRRVKTDKKDAIKIANYGLDRWVNLVQFVPEDDIRRLLKIYNRQYDKYVKTKTMLSNNFIALLDKSFPGVNTLFRSPPRKTDGRIKWVDFASKFWHCECVCDLSEKMFKNRYSRWCNKHGYRYSDSKASEIYIEACGHVDTLPKNESTRILIQQTAIQISAVTHTLAILRDEMNHLASQLPEYPVVMAMHGVGEVLGPQLMAEIGDVRRFTGKTALVAYAGIDAPPFQSGKFESHNRKISKRGSPLLRKALFLVMSCLMQQACPTDPVYLYLDKKRSEGKHFYVYMMAGSNKFLRIYYARVKEHLDGLTA